MNPQRFKQTRQLFDATLRRPAPDRQAFLRQACAQDSELRERVERLIGYAQDQATAPIETHPDPSAPEAPPAQRIARIGALAPEFDLPCTSVESGRHRVVLGALRGRWMVLIFYPRDFSLICPTELLAMSTRLEEFRDLGAEILGVSVDTLESHERWLATPRSGGGLEGLRFALASDAGGTVSRAYSVYVENQHLALRGIFIIDPDGVLQFSSVHNLSIGRRTDDILRVLSALQTGGLCAEDWAPGASTVDPTEALRPGSVVSHYRIEQRIGDGACGSVFRARDMTLKRTVALKVIKPQGPLSPGAILTEARAAAGLSHANVCTVYAVDEAEGITFIAMEHVRGRPLSELIDQTPLPPALAADIACQIAQGMTAAHAMGVVHGDLKPANVVRREDGVVKVLDFGLARAGPPPVAGEPGASWGRLGTGGLRGTPAYMSPEQASGMRATRRSDVFSLGVILYEMLTGESAFGGLDIEEILDQVAAVEPDRLARAVPEPFSSLLAQALVRDARARSITMDEIARHLETGTLRLSDAYPDRRQIR